MSYQSKRIHGWRSASSIDLRVKTYFFFLQTLRIRGALPTAEQTGVLMELGRACSSSPGDGSTLSSTLLKSAAFSSLLTSTPRRSAHCWMRTPRQRRAGYRRFWRLYWRSTASVIFSFYGKCWFLRQAAAHLICLGDGTADLQVAEGGATDGRRPPERLVIYSDYFITI